MAESEEVRQHLRVLSVICAAILSGILLSAGVTWYLRSSGTFGGDTSGGAVNLSTILNLAALMVLVVAHFLPRALAATGPGAPFEEILAAHKRSIIIGMALREGAALMAIVGVLLTGEVTPGMTVAGLAVVLILLGWPRKSQLEGRLQGSGG